MQKPSVALTWKLSCAEVAGVSLDDLLPQTRELLALLDNYVNQQTRMQKTKRCDFRFTQRELRETFSWSDRQVRRHLARLVELEYVVAFRTGLVTVVSTRSSTTVRAVSKVRPRRF